jgi:septal ring factor EnvC (AmiA/AmiB activator)
MSDWQLTPEQEAQAQKLAALIAERAKEEALLIARLLVSRRDEEIFGATEFEIRERVHKIGAYALETALRERKKGATAGPATAARSAARRPGS